MCPKLCEAERQEDRAHIHKFTHKGAGVTFSTQQTNKQRNKQTNKQLRKNKQTNKVQQKEHKTRKEERERQVLHSRWQREGTQSLKYIY